MTRFAGRYIIATMVALRIVRESFEFSLPCLLLLIVLRTLLILLRQFGAESMDISLASLFHSLNFLLMTLQQLFKRLIKHLKQHRLLNNHLKLLQPQLGVLILQIPSSLNEFVTRLKIVDIKRRILILEIGFLYLEFVFSLQSLALKERRQLARARASSASVSS
jgi:hypothetical protein